MEALDNFVVYAGNLHVGGGVQVAASFISEIPMEWRPKLRLIISSEVRKDLTLNSEEMGQFHELIELNTYGSSLFDRKFKDILGENAIVFTVFGPNYRMSKSRINLVGFAQPWIIYPNNACYRMLTLSEKVRAKIKFWIQGVLFKKSDILIVELEHVKEGLVRELGINPQRVHIVHNCLSSIYLDEKLWRQISTIPNTNKLKLGFLGRNYLHKNTKIIPEVVNILEKRYNIPAVCYVTFTEEEWNACSEVFKAHCINVGPLTAAQCPSFYKAVDGIIFPSILECFSATPLETLAMGKPLFASDLPFNREICRNHASYFDPFSPELAAEVIAAYFSSEKDTSDSIRAAREHAINFSSPKDRAAKYLDLLLESTQERTLIK
jgi:glycosyltransferase involved in cell wall biosynthesis